MLQILCKTPAAIFKIQIPTNTKSKFNRAYHPNFSPLFSLEICFSGEAGFFTKLIIRDVSEGNGGNSWRS